MSNILDALSNILPNERNLPMQYETSEPEGPVLWTDINGVKHTTPPGTMRTFSMNSREFYEAVTEPSDRGSEFPNQRGTWMPAVVPGVVWR